MSTLPDVTVTQLIPSVPESKVDVTVHVSATLNVTAFAAQQRVSGLALSEIGTGIGADHPELIVSRNRMVWRVPLFLALPDLGRIGNIGAIDVDAQTGEVLADHATFETLIRHAQQLAPSPAS
jgi:hypothetical protein